MFSYSIYDTSERETINGTPVTEDQIVAWVTEPSQVIALRLTANELSALDARAEREGKSRSEVIREALASA